MPEYAVYFCVEMVNINKLFSGQNHTLMTTSAKVNTDLVFHVKNRF